MRYTEQIKEQLIDYISVPAVLVDKNDVPYEFRGSGGLSRLKRRRESNEIPLELFTFAIENGVTRDQMREFASGLFLNYVEMSKIYT